MSVYPSVRLPVCSSHAGILSKRYTYLQSFFTIGYSPTTLVFAARCYASKAYAIMRCLCVCVSVTLVDHVNKDIFEIFSPSGSNTILVFSIPNGMAIFRREHPWREASNAGGVGRNRDSEPISGLTACVNAATDQVLSTGSRLPSRKLWRIAGSNRRCWLREKTMTCLWQEATTLRQRQQNSAFN